MYDILIKNGTIVDGTGRGGYPGSLGIKKNKIAAVGEMSGAQGKIEIDAQGKIVAPGFIDVHNHSDSYWQIFLEPQLPSLLFQGITTIIGGNCGASIAPLTDGHIIEAIQKWADIKKVNVDWLSFGEFAEKMRSKKFGTNFATLVGHGTLRRGVLLDEMRRLDRDELNVFEKLLEKSLSEGALGLSAGLAYSHEKPATWDELVLFAEIVKANDQVFSVHLRNESEEIVRALDEALDLARHTGVSLEISHLKIMGEENWPLAEKILQKIEQAAKSGLDINFDVYPYTHIGSVLYIYLPGWVAEGGKKALLRRLGEKDIRRRVIDEMKHTARYHYEDAVIAVCAFSRTLAKRKISEIAAERGVSNEEVVVDLLLASEGRVITLIDCLSEENMEKFLKHPLSIVASDGLGYSPSHQESGELVHPRCFGTFPRVLGRYVREKKLLSLEEAVQKMTSLPAKKFALAGRGKIEKGSIADIVVFDPETIIDRATIENPYQYSDGVEQVIVNGKLAIADGKLTKDLNGEFITAL